MKTKHIETLAELRQAKKELKLKMALADKKAKESFLYSTVNKLVNTIENKSIVQKTSLGGNVHSSLNFLSDKAAEKFRLGKTSKNILSLTIMIAAPIIAKKIQDYLEEH